MLLLLALPLISQEFLLLSRLLALLARLLALQLLKLSLVLVLEMRPRRLSPRRLDNLEAVVAFPVVLPLF